MTKVRPAGWWYALVPIVFVAGIVFAVVAAIDEGRTVAESYSRLGPDGRTTIELGEGDEATVFAIWRDSRSTETISRPPATVEITGPSGSPVAFDEAGGSRTTFSIGSDSGIDLGTFTATEAGDHEVRVDYASAGADDPVRDAAVGRIDLGTIAARVLRPVGLGIAGSIGLWIALLVLRGRSKRRARSAVQQPTYAPPAPPTTSSSSGPFV